MEGGFTDGWIGRFNGIYSETDLQQVPWFRAAPGIKLVEAVINETIPRGSRVVDLGCGPGVDSVFLATQGASVVAVDVSADALTRARQLADWAGVDVRFVQAGALDTGLPSGSADVVNDSFVFHNFKDEARAPYAEEVHRLLRPGGIFLLSSFSDRMVAGSGPRRITSGEILRTFTSDRFECCRLEVYRNLPTEARPIQIHWFAIFRKVVRSGSTPSEECRDK